MPIADKEFVLNYSLNRWKLNSKRNVGPTSESIRKCAPKNYEEWERYYFANVRSRQHIEHLGKILWAKVKDVIPNERRFHPDLLKSITETDCVNYQFQLVLKRTYDGYTREYM